MRKVRSQILKGIEICIGVWTRVEYACRCWEQFEEKESVYEWTITTQGHRLKTDRKEGR